MQKNRDIANLTELLQYPEFTSWAILKEALSVVRTGESTFSQTARLAHGYFNMRHDLEVIPWAPEYLGKNVKWKCVRSIDKQVVCDYCLRLFSTNSTTTLSEQQHGYSQNSTISQQQQNGTSTVEQQSDRVGHDNGITNTTTSNTTTTATSTPTVTNYCPIDVIEDCRSIMCEKCMAMGTDTCPKNLMNFCEFK